MNLIFDLDGTLWDSRQPVVEAWNDVLKSEKIGITLQINDLDTYIGLPQIEIIQKIIPNQTENEYQLLEKKFTQTENEYIRKKGGKLYSHVEETLNQLKKVHKLFIVSNCGEGYIENFLDLYKFHPIFSDFESFGRTNKPKAHNIKTLMKRNNLNNAIYIGDAQTDQEASKQNNIPFIFCEYGFGNVIHFQYKITQFSEIIKQLDSLKNNPIS